MLAPYSLIMAFLLMFSSASFAIEVVDGDTLKQDGTTFRLEGIDAPEHGQKCKSASGKTWPCGKKATLHLKKLVDGKQVECLGNQIDDFGRLIAKCNLQGMDLGNHMVEVGLAWAFRKFSKSYIVTENEAQQKLIGVWQAKTQTPWDYRADKWKVAAQTSPEGCPIKGNISKNGQIYHAPWSPWYSRTKISLGKGERWFCNEAEAVAAGWRAPLWGR